MAFDLDGIRRAVTISDTAARFGVDLKRDGAEFKGCCPFHKETTPSFTVFTAKTGIQRFHCFGCGESGDVLDFTMAIKGVTLPEAAEILGGTRNAPENRPAVQLEESNAYAGLTPVPFSSHPFKVGVETALYNPKRDRVSGFEPTHVHEYRDEAGQLYALVLRRTLPDGHKETPSVTRIQRADKTLVWSRFPIKDRRLYNLQAVAATQQVVVVEGEKCADAFNRLPGRVAVSWMGGGRSWHMTDWSPLYGKDIILWADHDEPGSRTMQEIAAHLADKGGRVRIIDTFAAGLDLPDGYDVADEMEKSGPEGVVQFVRDHLSPYIAPEPEPELPPNVVRLQPKQPAGPVDQLKTEDAVVADVRTRQEYLPPDAWRTQIVVKPTKSGTAPEPKVSANHQLFVEYHEDFRGVFIYDEAIDQIIVTKKPRWHNDNRPFVIHYLNDEDVAATRAWLERLELRPTLADARIAINVAAKNRGINSLKDALASLQWDGVPRLEALFPTYCGSADTDYARIAARRFFVQAVRRAMEPGCKAELMLILEGAQAAGKSTFCKIMAGDMKWATELQSFDGKDVELLMAGKWMIEVPELLAASRSDAQKQKEFLSREIDSYRPPYGTTRIERPRQCVFIGTHNPNGAGYLKDETGGRRFLPVKVKQIDVEALRRDRDQIMAEAMHLYRQGEKSWLVDDEMSIAAVVQESRASRDPWVEFLWGAIGGRKEVGISDLQLAVGLQRDQLNQTTLARISVCMMKLGWEIVPGSTGIVYRPRIAD